MNKVQVNVEQWQVAGRDMRFRDTWQLSSLRQTALYAYKRLDRQGDIAITYPVVLYRRRGQMVIWYDASMPHEWVLGTLRAEEDRLIREAGAERDALAAQMEQLVGSGADDILPAFEAAAAWHWELQRMLGGAP